MKYKDILKVNSIDSIIKSAKKKIRSYDMLKQKDELKIELYCTQDIIVTGKEKDDIIKILIDTQQNIIDEKMKELEKL